MRKKLSKFIIPKKGKTSIIFLDTKEDEKLYSAIQLSDRHKDRKTIYTYINVYIIDCEGKPNFNNRVKVIRASEQLGDQINSFYEEFGDEIFNLQFEITNNFNFQELVVTGKHQIETKWLLPNCCAIATIKELIKPIEQPIEENTEEQPEEQPIEEPQPKISTTKQITIDRLKNRLDKIKNPEEIKNKFKPHEIDFILERPSVFKRNFNMKMALIWMKKHKENENEIII